MTNKSICKQNQETFDKAWDLFWHGIDINNKSQLDKQWKIMWECVYLACCNIGKTKARGIRIQDLEDKCLDATCKIMENIGRGVRPEKLSSYVYLFCIGQLWNKKYIEWERSQSFEDIFDNYIYIKDDDNNIFLCKHDY